MFAEFRQANILSNITSYELLKDLETVDEVYRNSSPSRGFSLSTSLTIIDDAGSLQIGRSRGGKQYGKLWFSNKFEWFIGWLSKINS